MEKVLGGDRGGDETHFNVERWWWRGMRTGERDELTGGRGTGVDLRKVTEYTEYPTSGPTPNPMGPEPRTVGTRGGTVTTDLNRTDTCCPADPEDSTVSQRTHRRQVRLEVGPQRHRGTGPLVPDRVTGRRSDDRNRVSTDTTPVPTTPTLTRTSRPSLDNFSVQVVSGSTRVDGPWDVGSR